MKGNYKFMLAKAYSLYKGVCVIKQNGAKIIFLVEDVENKTLKENITNAFTNYIDYVKSQKNCPAHFKHVPHVYFKKGFRKQIKELLAKQNREEN
ncbi:hypothetical protein [Treponema sp. C6A8]|uniref:hypothetical protein n=1 Tax=Treponema sp. C6A8 TaxID=1410609 RepID=UPI00048A0D5D|nr:hypothetical protein [Treponema sp. C6A8]